MISGIFRGGTIKPPTIDLNGILGTFRIQDSPYTIRYFSTFANPSGTGGHSELVNELKPMRERVDASALDDLGSLMQRDLNDRRVAQELIPYLLGKRANIGFFPSILAVLVPSDFFVTGSEALYPKPIIVPDPDLKITTYDDCWSLYQYLDGETPSPLGYLKVRKEKTQIVVLDGQHRANAFRYISGRFQDASKNIYKPFYTGVPVVSNYDSDLPVTLIWFESESSVKPERISRRLFVDVNNTAKPVNTARTTLLDDRTVTCIGTQEIYNIAAARVFATDKFSLLHSAFDVDSDLSTGKMTKFAITTPDIVEEALRWAFFSSRSFDQLNKWDTQYGKGQLYTNKFKDIFDDIEEPVRGIEDTQYFAFKTPETVDMFRQSFGTKYAPVILGMFDDLNLLRPHYQACTEIANWIKADGAIVTEQEVWEKVFCGGEGLYWSFDALSNNSSNEAANRYKQAIRDIEMKFQAIRAEKYNNYDLTTVDGIYSSFATKAFQFAFVNAVQCLVDRHIAIDWCDAADRLIVRLNTFDLENWANVFIKLRPKLIKATDPKKWPSYRNLLIRMYDAEKNEIYNEATLDSSPDYYLVKEQLDSKLEDTKSLGLKPNDIAIRRIVQSEVEAVQSLLASCGLRSDWFNGEKLIGDNTNEWIKALAEYEINNTSAQP